MKPYNSYFREASVNVKDLEKIYNELNKKYFDGKLNTYPIKVKPLKTVAARVVSVGIKKDISTWKIRDLQFSNMLNYDDEKIKGVMLHEMIHVYMIENQVKDNSYHGREFKSILNDFNRKTPFEIPLEDDITNANVDKDIVKGKERIFLTYKNKDNPDSIIVFNSKLKNTIVDELKKFPPMWIEKTKPVLYISNSPELEKYPIKNKINQKSFSAYQIDPGKLKEIMAESELFHEF